MRIAQIAPPFQSVPPAGYGGTERVVSLLTEELVRRGHDVTLFASGDSSTTARLIPTVDTALWRAAEVRDPLVYWAITAGLAYGRVAAGAFDVVHSHLDFHAFACASLVPTPTVTTLHGRLDLPDLPRLVRPLPDDAGDLDLRQPARAAAERQLGGHGLQRGRHRPPPVQPAGRRLPGLARAHLPREGPGPRHPDRPARPASR